MASVQTGRDLPEAKWKECDVVGLLELILQVATVKDLFFDYCCVEYEHKRCAESWLC